MIKANELRIGNLVYNYDDLPVRIEAYDIGKSVARSGNVECEPIPLTPEILEAAGFEIIGTDHLGGWIKYKRKAMELLVGVGGVHFNHTGAITILQYLHQLQNLFHALTGEELTIDITAKTAY